MTLVALSRFPRVSGKQEHAQRCGLSFDRRRCARGRRAVARGPQCLAVFQPCLQLDCLPSTSACLGDHLAKTGQTRSLSTSGLPVAVALLCRDSHGGGEQPEPQPGTSSGVRNGDAARVLKDGTGGDDSHQ